MISYYKDKELENILEQDYKGNFLVFRYDGIINIYYNNKEYQDNDFILSNIFTICETIYSEEELFHIAMVYDYENIIKKYK